MKTRTRHISRGATVIRGERSKEGVSQLFLLRLWPGEPGGPEWCGKLQHVMSGEASDFADWSMLVSSLQQMLGKDKSKGDDK